MKNTILTLIAILFFQLVGYSQDNSLNSIDKRGESFKVIFENGFLIGNPSGQYPLPFSSQISIVKSFKNLYIGIGSGAEVIGRTYIPLFADVRYMPFKTKPLFVYGKGGYNFCLSNEYKEENNTYYGYDSYWPYPTATEYKWYGGVMGEAGIGVLLHMKNWDTSVSIGYRYQKTQYQTTGDDNKRTYENYYNRLALRLGFWF
jgi:hypothetical protein